MNDRTIRDNIAKAFARVPVARYCVEELNLMEAVCEAAVRYRDTQTDGDLLVLLAESDALTAYRERRRP